MNQHAKLCCFGEGMNMHDKKITRVAVVQGSSVFMNKGDTVERACGMIVDAAQNGADLVVFPEAFIPGYPDWVWLVPGSNGKELNELYVELVANAVSIPDSATGKLCETAGKANIMVAVGIHERNTESSQGSLYNSLLFIDHIGNIMGVHRKLIPTGAERLIWARGDGRTLHTFNTSLGRIGGLICWENFMPLARQSMYTSGAQILITPTWDKSEKWLQSMCHIAREGGLFVVSCCMALTVTDIPERFSFRERYPADREWINVGNSCVVNPAGQFIAGPLQKNKEILYADLDLEETVAAKRMFDAAGHYARPDVFEFGVKS